MILRIQVKESLIDASGIAEIDTPNTNVFDLDNRNSFSPKLGALERVA